jgi:hypothetical protein
VRTVHQYGKSTPGVDHHGSPGNRWLNSFGENGAIIVNAGASLVAAFLTTWNNMDTADEALISGTNLVVDLFSSIVDESIGTSIGNHDLGTSRFSVDCVLGRTDSVLGGLGSTTVFADDPRLTFPANGDFHLEPTSPAIDFCDSAFYTPPSADIDGETRGFDSSEKLDFLGPYDLGADEAFPTPPSIFSDGFGSGDSSAWSSTIPCRRDSSIGYCELGCTDDGLRLPPSEDLAHDRPVGLRAGLTWWLVHSAPQPAEDHRPPEIALRRSRLLTFCI